MYLFPHSFLYALHQPRPLAFVIRIDLCLIYHTSLLSGQKRVDSDNYLPSQAWLVIFAKSIPPFLVRRFPNMAAVSMGKVFSAGILYVLMCVVDFPQVIWIRTFLSFYGHSPDFSFLFGGGGGHHNILK